MAVKEGIIERLENNVGDIRVYGVKKIGLFGSFARGEQTPGSDIDILVEFEPEKKTFDNYMDLKFFLEDLFENEVELVLSDNLKADLAPYILGEVEYASGL